MSPTSYTTTDTLPSSPSPHSVNWGEEFGVLDVPVGFWDAPTHRIPLTELYKYNTIPHEETFKKMV